MIKHHSIETLNHSVNQ